MEILAFLVVFAVLIWLVWKVKDTGEDVDSLQGHVRHLELELYGLTKKLDQLRKSLDGAPATPQQAPEAAAPAAPERRQREAQSEVGVVQKAVSPAEPQAVAALTAAPSLPSEPPSPTAPPTPPPLAAGGPAGQLRPPPPPAPLAAQAEPAEEPRKFDLERFTGTKLLNWAGGFVVFLAAAWFFKYSIDNHLISPQLRVALGFLSGIGLLVGGCVLKRKAYEVTAQTLCATGVVILYAASFASGSYFSIRTEVVFALMALITVTAFLLAVGLNAMVVAILGIVGGFLTPPLLSTGVDRPLGLFGYIALLDAGLLAVALKRRWQFLGALGAGGTVLMQIGWAAKFFAVPKVFTAMAILLGFSVLFLAAFVVAERLGRTSWWLTGSAMAMPFLTLGFVFWLLDYAALGARPGVIFSFLLGADLCLLALTLVRQELGRAHLASGAVVFLALSVWTIMYLNHERLNWALSAYLLFAALHSVYPVVLDRVRPGTAPVWWGHLFPPIALLLVMFPLFKGTALSWLLWPCVLLIDIIAIGLAVLTASLVSILAVLVLTVLVTAIWVLRLPADLVGLPPILTVVGGFAVFFFIIGLFVGEKILAKLEARAGGSPLGEADANKAQGGGLLAGLQSGDKRAQMLAQVPALSAILPFLLLIMAAVRLPLANPSSVYGLALLLIVLLLGIVRVARVDLLSLVGLGCVLALEYSWHGAHFNREAAVTPLVWSVVFWAVFVVFPFLFRAAFVGRVLLWAAAALAGPLHFYLVYQLVDQGFPNRFMGVLPAAFAVPMAVALMVVASKFPAEDKARNAVLAWFGGSTLFFITLIFPIQWEKQWVTLGWALEGVALLWLFHRVPHSGLPATGVALLVVAFLRLVNPAIFAYHERSAVRIFNWYLYAHGIVSACLLAGGRLLAPPRNRLLGVNTPPVLYALGTVLLFFLMNLEIADYFSEGRTLTFQFRGNLARNMTYSIAWAMFAFVLLSVGVRRRLRPVRYAGLGLLGVTLLKLFLFDLANLEALYRVGALLGVGVLSLLASVLYQRFFSSEALRDTGQAGLPERATPPTEKGHDP